MMEINISVVEKIFSTIKTLFWKNSSIIYINSNKKKFDKANIDSLMQVRNRKWISCETDTKLGFKNRKYHLRKMKVCLYQILRNCSESTEIIYSGYVSPMFATFDGYCLGDSRNYIFVDTLRKINRPYKIEYIKKYEEQLIELNQEEEINLIVSSSYDIEIAKCRKCKSYIWNMKCNDEIDCDYLIKVYSWMKSCLDVSSNSTVKRINLYIAARQPVSFIIGTAIESGHPPIYVYDFEKGNYTDSLLIQDAKIIEGEKI